jgi:hypothetical protein
MEVPYRAAVAITKSDTVNIFPQGGFVDGVYCGGAGAIAVVLEDDTAVTFAAVPAGTILPIKCKRVNSSNTAATGMVGMVR